MLSWDCSLVAADRKGLNLRVVEIGLSIEMLVPYARALSCLTGEVYLRPRRQVSQENPPEQGNPGQDQGQHHHAEGPRDDVPAAPVTVTHTGLDDRHEPDQDAKAEHVGESSQSDS